ncbi:MAG: endonuclease/exonuclease/phosphatase family protein [Egibacteraceae bacterium]
MPTIRDTPPKAVAGELADLDDALDDAIPARRVDRNLLVATWNLRAFGGLTDKWVAGDDDSPKRDLAGLRAVGQIVSRFDVVALQEVRGNLRALRHLLAWLNRAGDTWGLLLTDVTRGAAGNDERMAFLYDTRRVKPSGLACELVVPPERDDIEEGAFGRQFARTPYACSFYGAGDTFILVALHVLYGRSPAQRVGELRAIARWLAEWASTVNAYHHNLIALGDFNIDRKDDPLYQALTSTGLTVPAALHEVPRTIFGSPTTNHYDQIAWFASETGKIPKLSLQPTGQAGSFDFTGLVHRDLTRQQMSWRISDHLPLWVEFAH